MFEAIQAKTLLDTETSISSSSWLNHGRFYIRARISLHQVFVSYLETLLHSRSRVGSKLSLFSCHQWSSHLQNQAVCLARRHFQVRLLRSKLFQDFNYIHSNCFEITMELSCCKYPKAKQLQNEWQLNKESLLQFVEATHAGSSFGLF